VGWLQLVLEAVSKFLTIIGTGKRTRRRRRRFRYSSLKVWGFEHTRFEITDDSQS
jgi:hypothetical protein